MQLTTVKLPPLPPPPPPAKPDACIAVDRIEISGDIRDIPDVTVPQIEAVVKPFTHDCQSNATVKAMMLSVNALYASKGFVTTQIYLAKQDIKKTRKVALEIKIGRVAAVTYEETPAWDQGTWFGRLDKNFRAMFTAATIDQFFSRLDTFWETIDDPLEYPLISDPKVRLAGASVIQPGEPLNLDRMQQGLDQINRASSMKAAAKLDPGPDPSTSIVAIKNAPDDAFRMIVGYDTYGTVATGVNRYRVEMARDNWIGINDTWATSLTSSRLTNAVTGSVSVPFQWFALTADASFSDSLAPIGTFAELYTQSKTVGLSGTYTIERTPEGRLDITHGLRYYNNLRYINDLELTPQTFAAIENGFTKKWNLGKTAQFTLGAKVAIGLKSFGATRDVDVTSTTPRAQFRKVNGTMALQWAITDATTLASNLNAQWSNTPLYSLDQLTLGSISSIRGFRATPYPVDQGGTWRNELSQKLPVDAMFNAAGLEKQTWYANRLKALEGYAFIDSGYGVDLSNKVTHSLVGAGVGLRVKDSRVTVDLSFAKGMFQSDHTTPLAREIYINVGIKAF
jgi:hemolysin activation/secretion protein